MPFISKIKSLIFHPASASERLYDKYLMRRKKFKRLAARYYKRAFGRDINWKNPEDLNQWINKLAFETDTTQWSLLADKYLVREFVANKGFADHLVPLLAVWENPEDIDLTKLPNQFVLKANNGSGDIIIVKDKSEINENEVKAYFKKLFSKPFGIQTAEPHYLRIKPVIIAEEFLDCTKQDIQSSSLVDYKIWCINGKPLYCYVISNRKNHKFNINLYKLPYWESAEKNNLNYDETHLKSDNYISKPTNLQKMLKIAECLSEGHTQMRVDLYLINNKIYFGECTLTGACGRMTCFTPSFLTYLGTLCNNNLQ